MCKVDITENMIAYFFRDPLDNPRQGEKNFSPLYLLRRDLKEFVEIVGIDHLIFPRTILVLIGLDILGFFRADLNRKKKRGTFLDQVFDLLDEPNAKNQEALIKFRHWLIHNFGGNIQDEGWSFISVSRTKQPTRFILVRGKTVFVNVDILFRRFENVVTRYKDELKRGDKLVEFKVALQKYGITSVSLFQ